MLGIRSVQSSMRYKLSGGVIVKSENAAKPYSQRSRRFEKALLGLKPVARSFDLGCGKLRYAAAILERSDELHVIDSEVQLSRTQALGPFGLTTIRDVSRRSNRMVAQNLHQFRKSEILFDRGFCLNVLQIVPIEAVRRRIISTALERLRPGASCFFVVQYRNSDFGRMSRMPNAMAFRDGILIDSLRGHSFYAPLKPSYMHNLVEEAGFQIARHWLYDGTCYVEAQAPC